MSKTTSTKNVRQYLESLTKDELIALVLKLAPQSFLENIKTNLPVRKRR